MALIAGDPVMIDCPENAWTRLNAFLPGGDAKVTLANVHFQKIAKVSYFFTFRSGTDLPDGNDEIMVRGIGCGFNNSVPADLFVLCKGGDGRVRLEAIAAV
jgi:hypothetical protein